MAKVDIELNSAGIKALLKGAETEKMLSEKASQIARRAGSGYGSDTKQMSGRVIASAFAETQDARAENMDDNTLLKALGGET